MSAAVVVACLLALKPATVEAQPAPGLTCNLQGFVCSMTDKNCVKLPTSLPIANGGGTTGVGWYNDGSQCGFNYNTKKACGDKLSKTVCNAESTQPIYCGGPFDDCPGDPGIPGDPGCGGEDCDYAAPGHLNDRLQQVAAVGLPTSIEQQLQAFAKLQSIHLKARAMVTVAGDANQRAGNSLTPYEYWAAGGNYRIHTAIDPRLELSNVNDLAFNGKQHQMMIPFGAQTLLSVSSQDTRLEPMTLTNPVFLPLSFLSAKDEQKCPVCELRLGDLQQIAKIRAATKPAALPAGQVFRVPGGRFGSGNTSFEVSLDDAGRVAKIRHLSQQGAVLDMVEFANYQPVAGGAFSFPMRMTETRNDEQGAGPWLTTKYVVDQLEVNGRIEDSAFVIPAEKADEIFESDKKTWLKRSDLTAQGLCKQ